MVLAVVNDLRVINRSYDGRIQTNSTDVFVFSHAMSTEGIVSIQTLFQNKKSIESLKYVSRLVSPTQIELPFSLHMDSKIATTMALGNAHFSVTLIT